MSHDHEYMHRHNIPHDHPQDCPGAENCGHDCEGCEVDPKAEVVALMKYTVNHNAAHAHELLQLAEKLRALGDAASAEQVQKAVSDFEKGNLRLSAVLAALNG